MKVRETIYGTTVITAEDGMVLLDETGGLSHEVYLAKGDDMSNYREITQGEADAIIAEQEASVPEEEDMEMAG